jgi:Flp pilus assembly protein TadG
MPEMPAGVRLCRSGTDLDDRGSAAVELALIAPALIFLLLLVVYAGRMSEADDNVRRAASEAARAASLRQHPADAADAARSTVSANLSAAGVPCSQQRTEVDTSDFVPGGTVAVTVRCETSMRDIALLGVPGSVTFQSHAVEVIDRLRSST